LLLVGSVFSVRQCGASWDHQVAGSDNAQACGAVLMVENDPVLDVARRLVLYARDVASARTEFERVTAEPVSAPIDVQREAMRRWQVAEDREHQERSRLAELLDVEASDLLATPAHMLYSCGQDARRPRHRRGTLPPEYTIYHHQPPEAAAHPTPARRSADRLRTHTVDDE